MKHVCLTKLNDPDNKAHLQRSRMIKPTGE